MPEVRLVDLHKEYPGVIAVKNVSITFTTATVTCLLGPSGCGKTTMMRIIAGLERHQPPETFFSTMTASPNCRRASAGSAWSFNIRWFTAASVFTATSNCRCWKKSCLNRSAKSVSSKLSTSWGWRTVSIKKYRNWTAGTRQKVAIARTVARQPAVILFDEPITSVDAEAKVQLKRALKELTRQLRQTIIYVTHDQTEAMTLADQIALMKEGEIVQLDAPRTLYNQPNDVFGGWFLGNPGMNFFEHRVEALDGGSVLKSPLFPRDLENLGIKRPGSHYCWHSSRACQARARTVGFWRLAAKSGANSLWSAAITWSAWNWVTRSSRSKSTRYWDVK